MCRTLRRGFATASTSGPPSNPDTTVEAPAARHTPPTASDDWVIVAVPIREHTGTSGSMSVSAGGRFAVSGVAGPDYDYQVVIRF